MSKISYIFVLFYFALLLRSISGFYEQDSVKAVDLINQQITQGLYAATAERSSNYARSFGAKIQKNANKLRPKRKQTYFKAIWILNKFSNLIRIERIIIIQV